MAYKVKSHGTKLVQRLVNSNATPPESKIDGPLEISLPVYNQQEDKVNMMNYMIIKEIYFLVYLYLTLSTSFYMIEEKNH